MYVVRRTADVNDRSVYVAFKVAICRKYENSSRIAFLDASGQRTERRYYANTRIYAERRDAEQFAAELNAELQSRTYIAR